MFNTRRLTQLVAPLTLLLLAACQTTPTKPAASEDTGASATAAQTQTAPAPEQTEQQQQQQQQQVGAPVGIFLADTNEHANWAAVNVQPDGVLYVNPQPVLSNEDLVGVQAGTGENREVGLLALDLTPEGGARLAKVTTDHPKMRLALVVGNTMLAAPGYSQPVTEGRLVFMVGTEANALAAAQAIAGDAEPTQGPAQAPAQ